MNNLANNFTLFWSTTYCALFARLYIKSNDKYNVFEKRMFECNEFSKIIAKYYYLNNKYKKITLIPQTYPFQVSHKSACMVVFDKNTIIFSNKTNELLSKNFHNI